MGEMIIEGEAVVTSQPITLLGFVDPTTGKIVEEGHELYGQSISGKIFVFPKGVGSTVGPYVLLNLKKMERHPWPSSIENLIRGQYLGALLQKFR